MLVGERKKKVNSPLLISYRRNRELHVIRLLELLLRERKVERKRREEGVRREKRGERREERNHGTNVLNPTDLGFYSVLIVSSNCLLDTRRRRKNEDGVGGGG